MNATVQYCILVDPSLFKPQPIVRNRPTKPSPLTRLLAEQQKKTSNPFYNFQKFNGEVPYVYNKPELSKETFNFVLES